MGLVENFHFNLGYPKHKLQYWLAGFFAFINLIYYLVGVRFDYEPLYTFIQFIDPNLLKSNLFESLFYLHSQPPLFNFFLGAGLNLFPGDTRLVFTLIYLVCGFLTTMLLFSLMVKLKVAPILAFIITSIFIASPAFILYENWLYSTLLEALFLCLAAYFLYNFIETNSIKSGVAFFGFLALLVLLRSSFHLFWFVGIALFIVLMNRSNWRRILVVSAIPFLIIFALYVKNYLVFGNFNSSSWLGMNFSAVALPSPPPENLDELIQSGAVSPIVKIARFDTLRAYKPFITPSAKTGIPVLDQEYKSISPLVAPDSNDLGVNFNNINFIEINNKYLKDDLYFATHQPLNMLAKVAASNMISFRPSSHYWVISHDNLNSIAPIDRLYTILFDGDIFQLLDNSQVPFWLTNTFLDTGWFILARFIIAVIYGLKLVWGKKNSKKPKPFTITIFFLVSTIIYYTAVSNLLDLGENNRFRFDIDPFCLVIFALFLQQVFERFRQRKPEPATPVPSLESSPAGTNQEIMAG